MVINKRRMCLLAVGWLVVAGWASDGQQDFNQVSGGSNAVPGNYAPPLVSNGSLCMQVDYLGGQAQREYCRMTPGIFWAGRRYGPPDDTLIPFGHFDATLKVDGEEAGVALKWSQVLDTEAATVTCLNEFKGGLTVETKVFTPLDHDMVVVRKQFSVQGGASRKVSHAFSYQLTPKGSDNRKPRRVESTVRWDEATESAEYRFQADGHRASEGIIAVFSDKRCTAAIDGQRVELRSEIEVSGERAVEQMFCLIFEDSLDGSGYLERAGKRRDLVRKSGFDGLLEEHKRAWGTYWGESYVRLPDVRLDRVYRTAQYHLRVNATKWSFPVGIFPTHWSGRFFGWDEVFCHQALISSNHPEIARRMPEFRFDGLKKALYRAGHVGRPGKYGVRYPWETLEDGSEGAPPGYWMDHIFHMSNIAMAAWFQYLYTDDAEYLKKTGYPVMLECARFFVAQMIYEEAGGGAFIGKCTDLERLGPAKERAFLTTCGVIYTLETAAEAAALAGAELDEAVEWRRLAGKLRGSLPHDGERYIAYPGCEVNSIAVLGGLFPYPLFDGSEARQKSALYHFIENGRATGNMYPVGDSICAWYAGKMAAALARVGDREEPVKMLNEAASGAGCFGELFEINEPKVSMRPWFSTASANFVYAVNQMLVQSRNGKIYIAQGAPEAWKEYAFKLACHGGIVAEVGVEKGRLARLALTARDAAVTQKSTIVMSTSMAKGVVWNEAIVRGVSETAEGVVLEAVFAGKAELVR